MTLELGPDDKRMKLRYAGTCRLCGTPLDAGADAVYERGLRKVRCVQCPAEIGAPEVVPLAGVSTVAAASESTTPESGTAGASARREFARRRDAREKWIRENHPKLGGLILALSDDPQSTTAWERGAIGEELLAARLHDLPDTFRVLHDRRIPRSRANIDHIAIGPTGVWVIDAKRYKDKRPTLHVEGGIIRPRVESLRIGGRDHTKLIKGVQTQVDRVTAAVGDPEVPVLGVLCFLDADWPLIGGSFIVDGIRAVWPRLLIKQMTEAPAQVLDVNAIHARLAGVFPSA